MNLFEIACIVSKDVFTKNQSKLKNGKTGEHPTNGPLTLPFKFDDFYGKMSLNEIHAVFNVSIKRYYFIKWVIRKYSLPNFIKLISGNQIYSENMNSHFSKTFSIYNQCLKRCYFPILVFYNTTENCEKK